LVVLILAAVAAGLAGCSPGSEFLNTATGELSAANDSYLGLGNSPLTVTAAQGVLANDPNPAPVSSFQNPTSQGGTVSVNADGSFTYTPPAGFTGTDTFTYTIAFGPSTASASVSITIDELAWYVQNIAAAGGNGTFSAPFNTLAQAEAASGPGDIIFVFAGDGTSTGQDAGITLKEGQQLIGEGQGLEFDNGIVSRGDEIRPQTIVEPGDFPVITNAAGAGVTLANQTTVAGVRLEATSEAAIFGDSVSGVTITNNQILAPAGGGVVVENLLGDLTVTSNTLQDFGNLGVGAFTNSSATMTCIVQSNQFLAESGADDGTVFVAQGQSNMTLDISQNIFSKIGVGNFSSGLVAICQDGAQIALNLQSNRYTAVDLGWFFFSATTGQFATSCTANEVQAQNQGCQFFHSAGLVRGNFSQNSFTANGSGLQFFSNGAGVCDADLRVTDNTFAQGGFQLLAVGNTSTVQGLVSGNDISDAPNPALDVICADGADLNLLVNENTCTNNAATSASFLSTGPGTNLCLELAQNVFTVGENPAIYQLTQADAAIFNLFDFGNTGTPQEAGTITDVPAGTCQPVP
jgi:hypothetical protein